MDNILEFSQNTIKILQLTDMQVIDSSQQRSPDRLCEKEYLKWLPDTKENNLYRYIRELVERTTPDIIIITGDITYGEFDDSGKSLAEFIEFVESFGIPWAPVYGNHDNESYIGVDRQNQMYENAPHCLFKKGNTFGNGNYSVAISINGKISRVICMMDSNGCGKLNIPQGFRDDQIEWLESVSRECVVPLFCCFHIPTADFSDAYISAGYQKEHDSSQKGEFFTLSKNPDPQNSAFGKKCENYYSYLPAMMDTFKKCRVDGVFAGHYHKINVSCEYQGVRLTMGLKTGLYDYHDREAMGGTLITLQGSDFSVRHEYCTIED